MNIKDIYWLAGFLEGEGSFYLSKGGSAQLSVVSTDLDIIQRVRSITNSEHLRITSDKPRMSHYKQTYRLVLVSSTAIQWMLTIYCLMSKRRQIRIKEILAYWRLYGRSRRGKQQ